MLLEEEEYDLGETQGLDFLGAGNMSFLIWVMVA